MAVGKMVMSVIGDGNGHSELIYGDYDELKKGGVYKRLEELAEQYILACLTNFSKLITEDYRPNFVTYLHETLWWHINGDKPMTDGRANYPIVADIKAEWDKLTDEQKWEFLD